MEVDLWRAAPERFVKTLQEQGLCRAYVITDPHSGAIVSSHPVMRSVVKALEEDSRDYDAHEGCFFEIGAQSGHLLSAFVHKTIRGQAAGGVRFWTYDTLEDFVRDGLRLSRGMGHKNALAGLWWGGGKGVIGRIPNRDHLNPEIRAQVYQDYGRFMSSLCGCYITAEDAGTTARDMAQVFATTRYTTCIPKDLGGSGNPSVLTAQGVVVALEAAADHLGWAGLEGKTIAIQGLGNVSGYLIEPLLERGVEKIVGVDIDQLAVSRMLSRYAGDDRLAVAVVQRDDLSIFHQPADILVPNAVGACLNPQTIPMIRAKVVCGGANNQLEDLRRDDLTLQHRDILYVPDFLANRMGIVNCANEQYGCIEPDPNVLTHLDREQPQGIYKRCLEVLQRAQRSGKTPTAEAVALAEELSVEAHPMWGHRGQLIINHLVQHGWERKM